VQIEDLAKKPMWSVEQVEAMLSDIRAQPEWRADSDKCADYYDDKQVTPELKQITEDRGQPLLVHNHIKPVVNGVLGLEVKTRPGIKLVADSDDGEEVVKALGQKIQDAARMALTERATADAYAACIKTGVGWVYVGRNDDPFLPPYETTYVHRRELYWDMRSTRADLSDARWMKRDRWLDCDTLKIAFPDHADLIDQLATGWRNFDALADLHGAVQVSEVLVGAYNTQLNSNIRHEEWWDSQRKMARVSEVYYRAWDTQLVMKTPSGDVVLFDENSPAHQALVAASRAKLKKATFSRMRQCYFVGPHRLLDRDSPHPHNHFPYIPFFGFREDQSGIPYGIIRSMIPPQDEINHRRSKLTWLLNIKRVVMDSDSLDNMSIDDVLDELDRGDGVITLNPNRKNINGFKLETETGIAAQQFQILEAAQKTIQDVAGVYSSFLGQESGAKSGIAINSLVEQGTVSLAEINDNYRLSRQLVNELLLAHIIDDIGGEQAEVRIVGKSGQGTEVITLNETIQLDDGRVHINNSVAQTKARVVIEDVPSTPGYRQQMNMMLTELVGKLPPELQPALIELVISTSDLDNRDEVMQAIRKATGSDQQQDPEQQAAAQQQQQQQQAQQQQAEEEARQAQLQAISAKVQNDIAEAYRKKAETEAIQANTQVDVEYKAAQTQKLQAEIKEIVARVVQARQQIVRDHVDPMIGKLSDQAA